MNARENQIEQLKTYLQFCGDKIANSSCPRQNPSHPNKMLMIRDALKKHSKLKILINLKWKDFKRVKYKSC